VSASSDKAAILLIEDAVEEIVLMRTIIEQAGPYQVTSVQDGTKGLELLLEGEWGLAFIDLNLPGLDGIDLIQQARERHPDLPIVVVTGSTSSLMIDGAIRAGADYVLNKPVDRDELLRKLHEFAPVGGGAKATSGVQPGSDPSQATPEADAADAGAAHVPTVVAVGARPGDVEMGCGGVLLKHRAEGHQVVILNLAGGGDPNSELAAAAVRAAAVLGAKLTCVGSENEDAVDLDVAKTLLQSVMAETSPGMLYLPTASAQEQSSIESHRVALASTEAVPNVLAYQCPSATIEFRPQFFVDVGPFVARKSEILECYSGLGLANVSPDLAAATARYWGRFKDPEHAEPLEVIRRGGV